MKIIYDFDEEEDVEEHVKMHGRRIRAGRRGLEVKKAFQNQEFQNALRTSEGGPDDASCMMYLPNIRIGNLTASSEKHINFRFGAILLVCFILR